MTTLNDLKQQKDTGFVQNPENLKPLSSEDLKKIVPPKEENDEGKKMFLEELDSVDSDLDSRQQGTQEQMDDVYSKVEEEVEDAIFDAPLEDADMMSEEEQEKMVDDVFKNASLAVNEDPSVKAGVKAVTNITEDTEAPKEEEIDDLLKELDDDDSEFDNDDDIDITDSKEKEIEFEDDIDEDDDKKMLKDIQEQVENTIKPFNNIIDLKAFTISTKARSASKVLQNIEPGPSATWVLLDSATPFTCTALGAVEIEHLDPNKLNEQNGRIEALKQMYGTLYKHYTSPNKPKTLEQWVKTISYSDHDNLIFGYYKATFGQSNLITYACDDCKVAEVKNIPIADCIKYKDDDTKKEVEKILKFGDPTHVGEIKAKLIQISDTLAVSLKSPSIYNIVFEFGVLDSDFTNKYANTLGTAGYIEDIYEIDIENQKLVPIRVKEDPTNLTKSVKRRIRAKVELLKSLTPDQYQILTTEIAKIAQNAERIEYRQPEYICQKCGKKIDESVLTAQEMLFIRHQLALIKTLSVE